MLVTRSEGLTKAGFIEGRNVRIEERWAQGTMRCCRLLQLMLPWGAVAIAATGDVASACAAQCATSTVPVVFTIGGDPCPLWTGQKHKSPRREPNGGSF